MKMSYLVGYGEKYSQFVQHTGVSILVDVSTWCKGWQGLESDQPDPNVAMGALVGEPFLNESYVYSCNNSMQTEPNTYNSAAIVGPFSGLVTTYRLCRLIYRDDQCPFYKCHLYRDFFL
ncbi:putative cellulase [Helianthus anomalus]